MNFDLSASLIQIKRIIRSRMFLILFASMIAVLVGSAYVVSAQKPEESFLSISTLGNKMKTEDYYPRAGSTIKPGEEMNWFVKVDNHMTDSEYVSVKLKVINSEQSSPDASLHDTNLETAIYEANQAIPPNSPWILPINWTITGIAEKDGQKAISSMTINGLAIDNLDIKESKDKHFRIIMELWRYNSVTKDFEFFWTSNGQERSAWNQIWFQVADRTQGNEVPTPQQPGNNEGNGGSYDNIPVSPVPGPVKPPIQNPQSQNNSSSTPSNNNSSSTPQTPPSNNNGGVVTGGGGSGGGGGSVPPPPRDTNPPNVSAKFSRSADTRDNSYNRPVTIIWSGTDRESGNAHCSPGSTNYSGPDGRGIVLKGQCTDNVGNIGKGSIALNYNSTETGNLSYSYSISLKSTEIPVGSTMSATATTNNFDIKNVMFVWKDPSGHTSASNTKATKSGSATDGFIASGPTGVWTAEAHFLDTANNDVITVTDHFAVTQPSRGSSPFDYSLIVNPIPVEKNNPIAANASTSNPGMTGILFVWTDPAGLVRESHELSLVSGSVVDSFVPNMIGTWRIDAHFNNSTHSDIALKIKSFTVIEPGETTPPIVTGIFSREPDIVDGSNILWYNNPVTISWLGSDGTGGSGVASCDAPISYSGPDAAGIVKVGHCTDKDGNVGTKSVSFNYNSTASGSLRHSYDLTTTSNSVQIGSSISANATTNNTSIKDVKFVWRNPSNGLAANIVVSTSAQNDIRTAANLFDGLNQTGTWTVDAHFLDTAGNDVFLVVKSFSVDPLGGNNRPPVVSNDSATTPEDTPLAIAVLANDIDPDGDAISVSSFTQPRNGSVAENANGTLTYSPDANFNGEDSFSYRISDGTLQSDNATVTIIVTPVNVPPIVNAGLDQSVNEETLVKLNGSAIDGGGPLKFSWSQITSSPDDPVVVLSNADTLSPTFLSPSINHATSLPPPITLTFQLVANDTSGAEVSDLVAVTVNDVNKVPVAVAGPDQMISQGLVVNLTGLTSSDADGDDLTYTWIQTAGPTATLSDSNSATPSFVAPGLSIAGHVITFKLIVSDGFGGSSTPDFVDLRY